MSAYAFESIVLAVRTGRPATEQAAEAARRARAHPRRLTRSARLTQLFLGVIAVGIGVGLMIRAGLGVASWDVLHVGLAEATGWTVGVAAYAVGAAALLVGRVLGQRPRLGTVVPLLLVGPVLDVTTRLMPAPGTTFGAWIMLLAGIATLSFGVGAYVTSDHGVGPSDMIFVGLSERGIPLWAARLVVDALAVLGGWLLGGPIGLGTIAITLLLSPLTQIGVKVFDLVPAARTAESYG